MKTRILIPLLLFTFLLPLSWQTIHAQENTVVTLEIEAPVTQAMADYFERGINEATNIEATAVLIILNTPGGDLNTTLNIVQLFRNAEIPIIVYIAPNGAQAASAGSIITAAAHAAAMAPETIIGAASPINADGSDINETAYRKAVEDLRATMRSLTERRGEEAVTLAEAMIEDARAVNAQEALEVGFIDIIANNTDELLTQLDGATVIVNDQPIVLELANASQESLSLSFIEQLLLLLVNPLLLGILFTIGVQAILIELNNPGGWVAGLIGILCLSLALYGAGQLPVNWLGLGLILIAFVLFVMEVSTPTNGALAITGTVILIAGLLVLFNSPNSPEFARLSVSAAISIGVVTASFFIFVLVMVVRTQRQKPITGAEALVGKSGPVRSALSSGQKKPPYIGQILVAGELWRAQADEPIDEGVSVVVTAVNGFTLTVQKTNTETA